MRLSEEWIHLVPVVAKRCFSSFRGDWRELLSEGELGLLKAEINYQPELGSFPSFAYACIKNQMRTYLRDERKRLARLPLSLEDYDGETIERQSTDDRDELERLIPNASERRLLMMRYGLGLTLIETGRAIGKNKQAVHWNCLRLLEQARKKIRGSP